MRFTASYDEAIGYEALAKSNDLYSLIEELFKKKVNNYHCEITEWDLENVDPYGCPEEIATVRMFLVEEDIKENGITDLINYQEF